MDSDNERRRAPFRNSICRVVVYIDVGTRNEQVEDKKFAVSWGVWRQGGRVSLWHHVTELTIMVAQAAH